MEKFDFRVQLAADSRCDASICIDGHATDVLLDDASCAVQVIILVRLIQYFRLNRVLFP